MLDKRTPIGIWSDEMPPINLHNYPMQNKPEYKHKEVAKTLSPNPSTLYLETQEAFKEAVAGYPLGALPKAKPGQWVSVPEGISIQEFAKELGMGAPTTRTSILKEADNAVNGSRQQDYGSVENSFSSIGELWNAYLGKEKMAYKFTPADVAIMLALLKVARLKTSPSHRDSWVDLAGYAACGAECGLK